MKGLVLPRISTLKHSRGRLGVLISRDVAGPTDAVEEPEVADC